MGTKIKLFHEQNSNIPKPKACLIVQVEGREISNALKNGYEENGIAVAVMKQEALSGSALVSESIKSALLGPISKIQEIMSCELLRLPKWWFSV